MKSKIVSVVIPVYNTSKYLDRCMTSILNQTLKDIEIILVDDGSTDASPGICDGYAEKDSRVKVIHKQNGGLSSARNAGLRIAEGKYVGFVDSDDDIDPDMYASMLDVIEKESVDFVMADYERRLADGTAYLKTLDIDEGRYDGEKIKKDIFPSMIMASHIDYGPLLSVWHCLYDREFLNRFHMEFDEQVRWSEDNIFSAIVGYNADSFYYMKGKAFYHYYQNEGTITTSYRKGSWDVYSTMNRHIREYFSDKHDYDFSQQFKWHMLYYACNCIGQTGLLAEKERKEEIRTILASRQLQEAFHHADLKDVPLKLKLQLYLMKYHQVSLLNKMIARRNK